MAGDGNGFRDVFLADFGDPPNSPPIAASGDVVTEAGESVTVALLADDPEGDDLAFEVAVAPAHGRLGEIVTAVGAGSPAPTVTYSPDPGFAGDDTFRIRATDAAGAAAEIAFTVEIAPPNQAPVIDLDSGTEGLGYNTIFALAVGGPVAAVNVDGLVIEDDDTTVVSATVTITNLLDGEAEGLAVDSGGRAITAVYDAGPGTLTLTGEDTLAAYEALLRTVTYDNIAVTPDTTPRLITFTVDDGESASAPAAATVFLVDDWTKLALLPGWNLLSAPADTPPWLEPKDLLSDVDGVDLVVGHVWVWDAEGSGRYDAWHSAFGANQGFWTYRRRDRRETVLTASIPGRLRGGVVYLHPGWNLIGPVVDVAKPGIIGIGSISPPIWAWQADGQCYTEVPDGGMLLRGQGYWLHVPDPDGLELRFPE